ncbi:MAG TPA: methylated-DNA--[protein]-cysteine S-methyltransferase [Phycisphaerales bacterium]|nr:methylated-DNA--[protein]-cysteine S-methyltransferase [Phycisphaerales bacterium]
MECAAWMDSPIGAIVVVAREGAVGRVAFADGDAARAPANAARTDGSSREVRDALAQLRAYFAGELREFDLMLTPWGTPFQARVLDVVRAIPFGRTQTYGEVARRVGREGASRAAGAANGRNPWAIVVPCHRVVGAGGRLTGYGGGMWRKEWLLGHEQARGFRWDR